MNGVIYIPNFVINTEQLFDYFKNSVEWDRSMKSRLTASFGKPYNYSQIQYEEKVFDQELTNISHLLLPIIKFVPNNCLLNYYVEAKSKMGYHSDRTDILKENTGIAIISLGSQRILRFRNIEDHDEMKDFSLETGSLIYMDQKVQQEWEHSILKSKDKSERISLTFRKIM